MLVEHMSSTSLYTAFCNAKCKKYKMVQTQNSALYSEQGAVFDTAKTLSFSLKDVWCWRSEVRKKEVDPLLWGSNGHHLLRCSECLWPNAGWGWGDGEHQLCRLTFLSWHGSAVSFKTSLHHHVCIWPMACLILFWIIWIKYART